MSQVNIISSIYYGEEIQENFTDEQIRALLNCPWTEKPTPQVWFSRSDVIALIKQVEAMIVKDCNST